MIVMLISKYKIILFYLHYLKLLNYVHVFMIEILVKKLNVYNLRRLIYILIAK